jgi:putative CocE/NonD family hydrolase
MRQMVLIFLAVVVALVASLWIKPVRDQIRPFVPQYWVVHVKGLWLGIRADYDVRIPMPDGVQLAASLYRPRAHDEKLATVLLRTPYGRLEHNGAPDAALFFATHGYAVVVEDIRGKYDSQGEFTPYRSGTSDGVATLDWIARQPWSNGKVGTFGCSALGELQFALARARDPRHRAMIASGAGGAMGSASGRYAYFGQFEGGIWQLSSGFGWFVVHGAKNRRTPRNAAVDYATALRHLPVVDLVKTASAEPNNYADFVRTPLTDPWWAALDFVSNADVLNTPALVINTWGDQTVGDTLALAEFVRSKSTPDEARSQHVVIGPGNHCEHEEIGAVGKFGDLDVGSADQPYRDWYLRWFDFWLRDRGAGLSDLPPYLFYMIGEDRWLSASRWPPEQSTPQRWYLGSGGHANGRVGDGTLGSAPPAAGGFDEYRYDPLDPVPSHGGPVCCTGDPSQRSGPVDQRVVEQRSDVLVYSSPPLDAPVRVAGPLHAALKVSSSALDTDFVARLVDVWPDGRATSIQEGALRARYRSGIDRPELLTPNRVTELTVDMRSIAYTIAKGHRLRLQITSSNFPRLERNLNTGGRNFDESTGVVAVNRIHHGQPTPSYVELPVLAPVH